MYRGSMPESRSVALLLLHCVSSWPCVQLVARGRQGINATACTGLRDARRADNNACDGTARLTLRHRAGTLGDRSHAPEAPRPHGYSPACYPFTNSSFEAALNTTQPAVFSSLRAVLGRMAACGPASPPFVVVAVGGSVTAGAKCDDWAPVHRGQAGCAFLQRFVDWLSSEYPLCRIKARNLGRGGWTTFYQLTRFSEAEFRDADLVVIDQTVNDMMQFEKDGGKPFRRLRAVVELLVRRIFAVRSEDLRPSVVLLSTLAGRNTKSGYQDAALRPVARHYHVPMISYRDAVSAAVPGVCFHEADITRQSCTASGIPFWKSPDAESLWHPGGRESTDLGHPDWWAHQLLADILAYSCVIARTDWRVVARRAPLAQTRVLRGPLRFFAQDVDPCGGMPLARITGERPRDFAPLEPPGPGWKFIKNGSKSGWEYDASDSVGAALEHMPSIKFTVRFGARPTLGVAALRSYENFGAGLAWVGDNDAPAGGGVAAHATAATRALLDWCQTVRTKPDTHHKSGAHEFLCHKIIVGTLPLPFYIPGHWDDRSSQADTTYFTEVTAVPQPHRFRAGTATFAPHNLTPIAQPNSTGVVTVVAWPPSNAKAAAQVGTKFRLMAITSC